MRTVNTLLNFTWTTLAFSVVVVFWFEEWQTGLFILFALTALAILFIPLRHLQFSRNKKSYEKTGVRLVNLLVQDGRLAKETMGNTQGRVMRQAELRRLAASTRMYERFHWMCLVFFLLSMGYAIAKGRYLYASGLLVANLVYNWYPILLQQYNRIRFLAVTRFEGSSRDSSAQPSQTGN